MIKLFILDNLFPIYLVKIKDKIIPIQIKQNPAHNKR